MATQTDAECCPEFKPEPWDDKIIEWDNKRFIKDHVFTFMYMPVNFGSVMKRLDAKVRKAGGIIADNLCLSDHTSKWNMDVYLEVDREIPDVENVTFSGKYYSKVYEGAYKDTGKWAADFENIAKSKGFNMSKMFMWYTTCPKCAKKYGKNYVAFITQME